MQTTIQTPTPKKRIALFDIGFRPFFLVASLFSIIVTAIWMAVFTMGATLPTFFVTPIAWHGHEMVFGYTTAIITGFLLTAVGNWTGVKTIHGISLALLTLIWLLARIALLSDSPMVFMFAALMDSLFLIGVILAIIHPIVKVKQWRQMMIVSKLVLILAANSLFYLGAFHIVDQGVSWGLYSGVYLIMALIFTLARRVMPFFIERGVGYQVQLKNSHYIDISSLVFLAALWIVDVFFQQAMLTALLSLILAVLHSVRIIGWYTKGIWQKPLLWVLFLGYGMFIFGFILKALNFFSFYPTTIPLHAFTYGGIGMITLGMVARVSLGHTGRNINEPPSILKWVFLSLAVGAVIRVVLPIVMPSSYALFVGLSQIAWVIAFTLFIYQYFMLFIQPRIDGV
ncbi:MAG: NnrS family protein [Gammaproteobacteria bacterium]|nr:NnrS family protein [Gammaproteobacteria bacterium]